METSPASIGTCFGFGVRASLPFNYLRGGDGPPLSVSVDSAIEGDPGETVFEWAPTARFPHRGRLHRDGSRFRLWIDTWGSFVIDPDGSAVTVPDTTEIVRREERLWSIPAMLCFRARGDTPLHAAAVQIADEAVLLAAPGTFGKTTLAAGCHAAGHRVLSEDNTCVRTAGELGVIPGPAMLRMRPDVAAALDIPGTSQVAVSEDRVHLAVTPELRGDCAPVPLRAIVLLRGSAETIRLERADPSGAVRDLFALAFRLPADEDRRRCFEAVAAMVRQVPVWNLWRPLTLRDLPATVEHVAAHA